MGTLTVEMSGISIPPLYILLLYLLGFQSKARNFLDSEDDFFLPIFRLALPFPCSQMEQLKTTSQVTGSHREYLLYEISIPLAFSDLDIISSLNWPGLGIGSPLSNGDPYGFGLGKKKAFSFGLGKRRAFSFGLGKRDPYAFGLGKKKEPMNWWLLGEKKVIHCVSQSWDQFGACLQK